MATYSLANERLRALEDIEREIGAILQNAGSGYEDERGATACTCADQVGLEGILTGFRGWVGLALGRGYTGGLRIAPPALRSGRYRDLGTVQGKNQREALRPTGSGLHRVGAARGSRAVGSDSLSHSGVCGGTCYAPTPALCLSLILQESGAQLWTPGAKQNQPYRASPSILAASFPSRTGFLCH